MTDVREQGVQVFRELLPGVLPDGPLAVRDGSFDDEILEIAMDNVFGRLWTQDGLSHRDRSLVTRIPRRQHRVQAGTRGV